MEVVVGRVGRPHGVKGDVTVEVRTDEPERRLAPGARLDTVPPEAGPLVVGTSRAHAGRLLIRFEGVHDRDAATALRGVLLTVDVDPDERPADPDEYYDRQLVGLAVVDRHGATVGEVSEVVHLPGQELLAVTRPEGGEALVPFVAAMVPEVDLERRRVVIDPPEGLLDLDSSTPAE